VQPLATNAELQEVMAGRYLRCIKEGIVAALRGAAPGRRDRVRAEGDLRRRPPVGRETDRACKQVKAATT
jgi:hypothetical protein